MSGIRWFPALILFAVLVFVIPEGVTGYDRAHVRNVILIVVDTLAASNLGFMDYERNTSPFLDKLASESIVFENAYTPKAQTKSSFTSIFSGLHPMNHGVLSNGMNVPEDVYFLTEDFRKSGFATWGVPAFRIIGPQYGFNRGFDYYGNAPLAPLPASRVIERVRRILENEPQPGEPSLKNTRERIFLFIHFFDTHTDYNPDPQILKEFAEPFYDGPVDGTWEQFKLFNQRKIEYTQCDLRRVTDLYDAEIKTLDRQLENLFATFERAGLLDNSVIVFTADHGENLGEHHFITHGPPYEKSLHIPLFIRFPNGKFGGQRINTLVENTDILPTIMDILHIRTKRHTDGISLKSDIFEDLEDNGFGRNFLLACGDCNDYTGRAMGIFDGEHRLTANLDWSFSAVMFNVTNDPAEKYNLVDDKPAIAKRLEVLLNEIAGDRLPCDEIEYDSETLEMLRSLGYVH